jgi:hypothetical protein
LISEPQFTSIVEAIKRGMNVRVFSPQLHGMEHYWPAAVMRAAREQPDVQAWLVQEAVPRTEQLPAPLQSRWIDGSVLPSRELQSEAAVLAACQEAEAFSRIFGVTAAVAVPPTFVWTELTEAGWAKAGVKFVVTPGERYFARDSRGAPIGTGKRIHNGQLGDSGVMYLVRDDYMEPALGHRAERGIDAVAVKSALRRPTLLETHRFNFTGPEARLNHALSELDRLLAVTLERFPDVQFMSTEQIAQAIACGDRALIDTRALTRIHYWLLRSTRIPRLKKLAWITGAIVPGWLVYRLTCLLSAASQTGARISEVSP